jgi:hypothetical protein
MDIEEGFIGDFGTDSTLPKATKSLLWISLPEIPNYLPPTPRTHPTEHERGTRLEQSGET